jgi:hypothetical protein
VRHHRKRDACAPHRSILARPVQRGSTGGRTHAANHRAGLRKLLACFLRDFSLAIPTRATGFRSR